MIACLAILQRSNHELEPTMYTWLGFPLDDEVAGALDEWIIGFKTFHQRFCGEDEANTLAAGMK